MASGIRFADFEIGPGNPCFIIAEAGVNHNGRLDLAKALIDAAVHCGASSVKFQTFTAEKLVTRRAPKARYQQTRSTNPEESQFEMLKQLELTHAQFQEMYEYCREKNILFLSSPFDEDSADFLESLGVVAFKIGSGEITNLPFLGHIARKNKPILLSTGMSTLDEVKSAVQVIFGAGNKKLALFHCTSNYPAIPADVNLRAMHTLANEFGVPVGYSDHTEGNEISFAAVALGASMLERHFTLDKDLPGPDHRASLEPAEFESLVKGVRKIEAALGDGRKIPASSEQNTAAVARKSLVAARTIQANSILSDDLIEIKRPGTGLPPSMKPNIIGRKTRAPIQAGDLIRLEDLE
jgi:N-acetylneuraminate synthase